MRITRDSLDRFFDYNLHLDSRTLFIGGEIDELTSECAVKGLHLLAKHSSERETVIILNSPGGCWYNGMAIYDAIKAQPYHITIEVLGQAMSMGSVILQAADVRVMYPNATLMIHDGMDELIGTPKTAKAWADYSTHLLKVMYEIYSEKSGKCVTYWEKKCGHDYILTAEAAVNEGLADKIYEK